MNVNFGLKTSSILLSLGALVFLIGFGGGCASFRMPRIDRSGRCLFTFDEPSSSTTETIPPQSSPPAMLVSNDSPRLVPTPSPNLPGAGTLPTYAPPVNGTPIAISPSTSGAGVSVPGFSPVVPGTGRADGSFQSTANIGTIIENGKTAIVPSENVHTTNNKTFAPGGVALPVTKVTGPGIFLTPGEQIAPVGSEVLVIGSFLGYDQFLRTNQRVEWSLDGVGHIMDINSGSYCDWIYGQFQSSHKVNDRYVVTTTTRSHKTLDRGTASTKDDINILPGQSWISINSTREGTSHIAAIAPKIGDWQKRTDAAKIHWVDVQWLTPKASINPASATRTLTTHVRRKSNQSPRVNWIVQYELLSGPDGGFGPSKARLVEVTTDSLGQARTDFSLNEMKSGTNSIAVRIIRPDGIDGGERRIVVGSEVIRQTWTTSGMLSVKIKSPPEATLGQDMRYVLTVSNSSASDTAASLTFTFPNSMRYISSSPNGSAYGRTVRWELTKVPAKSETDINVVLRAESVSPSADVEARVEPRNTNVSIRTPVSTPTRPENVRPGSTGTRPPVTGTTRPGGEGSITRPDSPGRTEQSANIPPVVPYNPSTPSQPSTQRVRLRIHGPRAVEVGELVRYSLVMDNISGKLLNSMTLVMPIPENMRPGSSDTYPLVPKQANKGSESRSGTIFIKTDITEIGKSQDLIVEFEAKSVSDQVRIEGYVTDANGAIIAKAEPRDIRIVPTTGDVSP